MAKGNYDIVPTEMDKENLTSMREVDAFSKYVLPEIITRMKASREPIELPREELKVNYLGNDVMIEEPAMDKMGELPKPPG